MQKPFLSFNQQLSLMEQRGLNIDVPQNEAERFLAKVSYFHLSQYRFVLESGIDRYRNDALFSSLCNIYKADAKLRNSIFAIISEIEIAFRTQLAYQIGKVGDAFSECLIILTKDKKNQEATQQYWEQIFNTSLSQHIIYAKEIGKKIIDIEPWVALEGYDFGSLLYLYEALPKHLQVQIQDFFLLSSTHDDLKNALYALKNLRNITAHQEAIICRFSFVKVASLKKIILPEDYLSLQRSNFKEVATVFPDLYPPYRYLNNPIKELFLPYYKILKYFSGILNLENEETFKVFAKLTQQYATVLGLRREWLE